VKTLKRICAVTAIAVIAIAVLLAVLIAAVLVGDEATMLFASRVIFSICMALGCIVFFLVLWPTL